MLKKLNRMNPSLVNPGAFPVLIVEWVTFRRAVHMLRPCIDRRRSARSQRRLLLHIPE